MQCHPGRMRSDVMITKESEIWNTRGHVTDNKATNKNVMGWRGGYAPCVMVRNMKASCCMTKIL